MAQIDLGSHSSTIFCGFLYPDASNGSTAIQPYLYSVGPISGPRLPAVPDHYREIKKTPQSPIQEYRQAFESKLYGYQYYDICTDRYTAPPSPGLARRERAVEMGWEVGSVPSGLSNSPSAFELVSKIGKLCTPIIDSHGFIDIRFNPPDQKPVSLFTIGSRANGSPEVYMASQYNQSDGLPHGMSWQYESKVAGGVFRVMIPDYIATLSGSPIGVEFRVGDLDALTTFAHHLSNALATLETKPFTMRRFIQPILTLY